MLSDTNLHRVILGKKPIQKLTCRLGWHIWTTWEILEAGSNTSFRSYTMQCHCANCDMVRHETVYSKSSEKSDLRYHKLKLKEAKYKGK